MYLLSDDVTKFTSLTLMTLYFSVASVIKNSFFKLLIYTYTELRGIGAGFPYRPVAIVLTNQHV